MNDEIERLDLGSEDLVGGRVEELLRLFPEAATEGTGRIDFERLRLALGDEVAEGDERYAFTWPGKRAAIAQAQTPSYATLRPAPEESVDWDTTQNLYIEGDNLEVLKLLQRSYHGRVKLIYIDPPYNTGHDFVYEDSFGDSIATYREQAGLAGQANPDTSGRYHSRWCSMMYPRLKLARELLADDGVIFISIDDNEVFNLFSICNEIFGTSCFVTDVVWRSADASSNDAKSFSADYNHTLLYSKNPGWGASRLPRTEADNQHYSNPDNDPKGPWFSGNVSSPNPRENLRYTLTAPNGNVIQPPNNGWRWGRERMAEMIDRGEVIFSEDGRRIIKKTYLCDQQGIVPSNLWVDLEETGHNRNAKYELRNLFPELPTAALFKTPKPTKLIRKMLKVVDKPDDGKIIVLDFFAGSGTTADAIFRENFNDGKTRKWICVQLPESLPEESEARSLGLENLSDECKERIRRAGKKIASEVDEANRQLALGQEPKRAPDVGFRVLKLDESGIARPAGTLQERIVGADRSQLDIVFELMLKWGLDLTYPVERVECAGYPCWSVAAGELVCCLEQGLSMEALHAVAALGPRRVLLLDSILTDTLKLNAQQIFSHAAERLGHPVDLRTV